MGRRGLWRLLCAAALLLALPWAAAEVAIPPLKARVTDLTATLTSEQRTALERELAAFEARKGSQIGVLIVLTTQPEAVEQYAVRVEEAWKLGRKGVDDGVLLLVAKDDHRLWIEVGYGLEGTLPDAIAKRIIEEEIVPRFKQGDFYGGISAGVGRIIKVIDGEPLPPPKRASRQGTGVDFQSLLTIGFVLVFVVGGIVRAIFGRFLGSGIVGIVVGFIAYAFAGAVVALVVGAIAFVLGLFGGTGYGGRGYGGWGGGGYSGGWSSGGGSWGGGGGMSGGGGAGGRW